MATHSSIAWEILWTEEPGGLQPIVLLRAEHDCAHTHFPYSPRGYVKVLGILISAKKGIYQDLRGHPKQTLFMNGARERRTLASGEEMGRGGGPTWTGTGFTCEGTGRGGHLEPTCLQDAEG